MLVTSQTFRGRNFISYGMKGEKDTQMKWGFGKLRFCEEENKSETTLTREFGGKKIEKIWKYYTSDTAYRVIKVQFRIDIFKWGWKRIYKRNSIIYEKRMVIRKNTKQNENESPLKKTVNVYKHGNKHDWKYKSMKMKHNERIVSRIYENVHKNK